MRAFTLPLAFLALMFCLSLSGRTPADLAATTVPKPPAPTKITLWTAMHDFARATARTLQARIDER